MPTCFPQEVSRAQWSLSSHSLASLHLLGLGKVKMVTSDVKSIDQKLNGNFWWSTRHHSFMSWFLLRIPACTSDRAGLKTLQRRQSYILVLSVV